MADTVPPSPSSSYADEGTACHNACELLLNDPDVLTDTLLQIKENDTCMTEDLLELKVFPAYDALNEVLDLYHVEGKDIVQPEVLMEYSELVGGSTDVCAASDEALLAGLEAAKGADVYINGWKGKKWAKDGDAFVEVEGEYKQDWSFMTEKNALKKAKTSAVPI